MWGEWRWSSCATVEVQWASPARYIRFRPWLDWPLRAQVFYETRVQRSCNQIKKYCGHIDQFETEDIKSKCPVGDTWTYTVHVSYSSYYYFLTF